MMASKSPRAMRAHCMTRKLHVMSKVNKFYHECMIELRRTRLLLYTLLKTCGRVRNCVGLKQSHAGDQIKQPVARLLDQYETIQA